MGSAVLIVLGHTIGTAGVFAVVARVLWRRAQIEHTSAMVCVPRALLDDPLCVVLSLYSFSCLILGACLTMDQSWQMGLLTGFMHLGAVCGVMPFSAPGAVSIAGGRVIFSVLAALILFGAVGFALFYSLFVKQQLDGGVGVIEYETVHHDEDDFDL